MEKTPLPTAKTQNWKKIASCLYRYKSATYYGVLKIQGKQVRQSLGTSDLKLANRKLRELRNSLDNIDPNTANRTLAQHRALFLPLQTGAESTLTARARHIEQLINQWPKGAPVKLSAITPTHIKAWLKTFADALDSSSINQRVTTLRKFFDQAVDDRVMSDNPMDKIKYRKVTEKRKNTPTEEQFRALVDDIRSQKANGHGCNDSADFVELAGTLGLGQAELSGIRRQDIDLRTNRITLLRKKTQAVFTIPIFPDARPIIERRLANMEDSPTTRLLPQDNCRKAMEGACKRLNFPHFEPRSLRRFHITRCLRLGIDAPTVGYWQGHSDGGKLVLKCYQAEMNDSHSQRMAAMLGATPANVLVLPTAQSA